MEAMQIVMPADALLREVFGSDGPSQTAYKRRLKNAERRGLLPKRRYISRQRWCYLRSELEGFLAKLPSDFAGA